MPLYDTVEASLRRFRRAQTGAVAILMAMSLFMIGASIGAAIDYNRSLSVRSKLQAAVDAASLAASNDPGASTATVSALVTNYLKANGGEFIVDVKPSVSFTRSPDGASVNVILKATVPTTLLQIVGVETIPVSAQSGAGQQLGESEIWVAIDMSASLGLAADPAARAAMEAMSQAASGGTVTCMFGCHQPEGWEPAGKTMYQMAREANIALREDVLVKAFGTFADGYLPSSDPAVQANRKRMAVVGFSDSAMLLQAPTNDVGKIKAAPAGFPAMNRWNTKYEFALPQIKSMVGSQGTGLNGTPQKVLLLVTDGLQWTRNAASVTPNGPIDLALCDQFKSAGVTLAVLEVKYLESTGEYWFENQVRPLYPTITPGIQACASPGFYFQATDSDATSLATSFSKVAAALRTQLSLR